MTRTFNMTFMFMFNASTTQDTEQTQARCISHPVVSQN